MPAWAVAVLLAALCFGLPAGRATPDEVAGTLQVVAIGPGGARLDQPDDSWTIYLDGFIDHGAASRLTTFIDQQGITTATVYLNSPGGSLLAAMALGKLLRQRRYGTDVGKPVDAAGRPGPGVCFSACPFAYVGGVRRSMLEGSVLGLHRAENRVPVPDEAVFQQVVSGQAAQYLAEMGVAAEVLDSMSRVPHDAIGILTRAQAEELKLVTVVPGPEEAARD